MIRVGVFMGGPSLEQEVSFNSGRTICDYIDKERYTVISLFVSAKKKLYILPWQFVYRGKISDFKDRLETEAYEIPWENLKLYIDFAYLALHGHFGEDGTLQGFFEVLGIPYLGSSIQVNAIAINKSLTQNFLSFCNIQTPRSLILRHKDINLLTAVDFFNISKKIVVKPIQEGSSLGISYVTNEDALETAIQYAQNINPFNPQDVVLQEYISGREFTVIAVEHNSSWEIFCPTEIEKLGEIYTYEKKYLPGATQKYTPARFPESILTEIKSQVKVMLDNLYPNDIIRFDGILENYTNKIFFLDINTFPGTAPSSYVFLQGCHAGYQNSEIINNIIDNSIQRFIKKAPNSDIQKKILAINNTHNEKKNKKISIAIFLGGNSNEREISLESGRNVFYTLCGSLFEKHPIFVSSEKKLYRITLSQLTKDTTEAIESSLSDQQFISMEEIKAHFNFVFIALHGGYGENGILQKELELLQIPYNGSSSQTSSIGMNKYLTANKLQENGLHTPEQLFIDKYHRDHTYEKKYIEYLLWKYKKIIIKPHDDGCSAYIYSTDSYQATIEHIILFWHASSKTYCLLEGAIKGIEITIGCIGNRPYITPLPITETVKNNIFLSLEEKFLPGEGENITPARINKINTKFILQQLSQAYTILGCDGYIRMDCFWLPEEEKLIFLECNTLPALTPATCLFHQAAEINLTPQEFLSYIIYLGFQKHNSDYLLKNDMFNKFIDKIINKINTNI